MKRISSYSNTLVLITLLVLLSAFAGCKSNPAPVRSSTPAGGASRSSMTDAKRLTNGANKLLDAMSKPTHAFHFSFKGQENVSEKYTRDKTQPPEVGPVTMEADISPEEISLTETRGKTTRQSKAKKGEEMNWAMANLSTLGVVTSPNFVIAVGSTVASSPSSDLVGTTPADKFTFDTATATPEQKMGLAAARMVLTTIKDCKGTAWIAKDSGLLIKFNINADYQDQNNHSWAEHYEGEVTPK